MAPEIKDSDASVIGQGDFQVIVQGVMREAVRTALTAILEEEVTALVGARRCERSATRTDQRNSYYTRDLVTSVGPIEDLAVPRTRRGFQTRLFERYHRRREEVDAALCAMFVHGVSTTRVGEVTELLHGNQPSGSTVSRVFHTLDDDYAQWKARNLADHYQYAFADGTYFTVIYDHEGHKTPILAVVGITPAGEREVLGFTVGDRENQGAWEGLLDDLMTRGVKQVDL
jgi:putative transposase